MTETATQETASQADENVHIFDIPKAPEGSPKMQIEIAKVPAEVRMDMLKKSLESYVKNSVNQANIRYNKANEAWKTYDNAMKADPNQKLVPEPEGERPSVDLVQTAVDARERLYKGEVRKAGARKTRKTVDPLTKLVTEAVQRELFDKNKAQDNNYKWGQAVKAVGSDGIAYLNGIIDAKVAGGADRAELEKFMATRYIQPAKLMLGQRDTKTTEGVSLFD